MGRIQRVAEDQILFFLLLLNESSFLLNMSRLTDALDERFNDIDEVKDVSRSGCVAGVSGFIYYGELRRFFFEHETDIESYIEDNYGYQDFITNYLPYSVNDLIQNSVWLVVEIFCTTKLNEFESVVA